MSSPSMAATGAATAVRGQHNPIGPPTRSTADRDLGRGRVEDAAAVPPPAAPGQPVERRTAPRRHASLVPSITGLRLSPCGGEASLVSISTSGVLVKCNTRLTLGSGVKVMLDGTFSPSSIKSRVARCFVADIDSYGVLWYHVGIVFNEPITLDDALGVTNPQPAPAPTVPAVLSNRW